MDLLAAVSLVLIFEGVAAIIFAASLPELLAAIEGIGSRQMRLIGIVMALSGAALYLLVRA